MLIPHPVARHRPGRQAKVVGVSGIGQSVTLPSGNYQQLMFLGSAVKGSQIGIFKISYSDGTSTTFTQALSDWSASPTASGEMLARSMSAYNRSNGKTIQQSSHVYAYSFALDSSKKVVSITLPNNRNIKLLAMDVIA